MTQNQATYQGDDGEWRNLGTTQDDLVLSDDYEAYAQRYVLGVDSDEVPDYEPGGILMGYSEGDVAFTQGFYARLAESAQEAVYTSEVAQASIQSMIEQLAALRELSPNLFEDIEPLITGDAMSVRYTDEMESSPL